MLRNRNLVKHERHPFHLVDPSPWPIMTGGALLALALGFISAFCRDHFNQCEQSVNYFGFYISLIILILVLSRWFKDIIIESTFEGHHTRKVQENVLLGMKLFIVSEVMFFFSFFWAYFHFSLTPSIFTGGIWPCFGIPKLDPLAVPFLNTVILLSSGFSVTYSHKSLQSNNRKDALSWLGYTIFLGMVFTVLQGYEYSVLPFNIDTNVYGSIFYMITGFHGFHVIVGTIMLFVCLVRIKKYHNSNKYHVGFICALWYWHFVDIVWLGLYLIVYIWGGSDWIND